MRNFLSLAAGLILGSALPFFYSQAADIAKEPAFQENFYGVQILDDQAWIVGYYGTVLHSKDKGMTWEIQPGPTRSALFRVRFVSPEKGWISGSYGTVLHTADGGRKWTAQPTGTTEHLLGLDWADEKLGWAVGSRGAVLRTADGGRSWSDLSLPEDLILSSVSFVNPAVGWAAGEFGVIYRTRDGGKSWRKQQSPVEVSFASGESRNLFALLFLDSQKGWAFGLDGVVLRTENGARWEVARRNGNPAGVTRRHHLFAAAAFNGRLWAVGERGTLLHADSDGKTWQQSRAGIPPVSLNDIAFGKNGFGLIAGNRGVMLRTQDSGVTWQRLRIVTQGPGKGASRAP
jgi:photosystem II stability/assembly factor-like uncharacterized protein